MKTLKITEQTHWELTQIISKLYKDSGVKLTYSEAINFMCIFYEERKNDK